MALGTIARLKSGELASTQLLLASEPVAWFLFSFPIFLIILRQPAGSILRWGLLPLCMLGPILSFWKANNLSFVAPGLGWIWAYTCVIGLTHGTCGICLESWYLRDWDLTAAYKLWNNPRRLHYQIDQQHKPVATQTQRLVFVLRRAGMIVLLGALYNIIEVGIKFAIFPFPKDFNPEHQTYFHFILDRQAKIRAIFCLQWAWMTWMALIVANAYVSILFVGILQVDTPEEWPGLYGNLLRAYSLRRYWSQFSHNIGAPSQAAWGRAIARHTCLRVVLRPGSRAETTFVICFVFFMAGLSHALVSWRIDPNVDPIGDMKFLMLNFAGGLFEFCLTRLIGRKGPRNIGVGLSGRILGYAWVFAFFYCTVPPWQWPLVREDVARTVPDVHFNVQLPRRSAG